MDADLILTIGVALFIVTIPSLLSAYSEGEPPRVGAILLIAAMGLVVTAVTTKPGGYAFREVPGIMLDVTARYIN